MSTTNLQPQTFVAGEKPRPNEDEILTTLSTLFRPEDVVELRILPKKGKAVHAGYFDAKNWPLLAQFAAQFSVMGDAVYITLNPVDPQLINRYANRIESYAKASTTDRQVIERRWLLIDLDPVRPSGTSATESQVEAALNKALEIHDYLKTAGWPSPLTAMSGNGFHLLYRIELPNDEDATSLVKGVLEALAHRFDDDCIKVDRTVCNAARICKLYGTVANKGDHTEQAPWRASYVMDTPSNETVTRAQLLGLSLPKMSTTTVAVPVPEVANASVKGFNLEEFFQRHDIEYNSDRYEGSERFKLAACPFNPEHVNGEAAVFRKASGELGFKCQHDSCASHRWKDVRRLLDGQSEVVPSSPAAGGVPTGFRSLAGTTLLMTDHHRLRSALASIPSTATLGNHTADQVVGMALRHTSTGMDETTGRQLCVEWDASSGGVSTSVFDKSDPNYAARQPLGLPSIYKLARSNGWIDTQPWNAPTQLPNPLPPVAPFTEDLLPEALGPWIMDIAHRMQCPPDFVAVSALVALSSVVGARAVIQPKAFDTWQVVPNLWGMVVGRPGVKKSPALSESMKPLNRMQERETVESQVALQDWDRQCQLIDMQNEANEKLARRIANSDPVTAMSLLTPLPKPDPPVSRRYIVNDVTVEKLGELLQENPWGILSYRDEISGLLMSLDKQGQEGARAFMLQGYDGNQSYTFDRIGRGTVHIPRVCLSLIGGIQPGRIQEYVRGAVSGGSADDGLMQRFGLAVWPDLPSQFIHVDQVPDAVAKETAWAVFERLAKIRPTNETEPVVWRFDEAAQSLFVEWLVKFEQELRGEEMHPALVSHLSKYRKLIPALALLFALVDSPDGDGDGTGVVQEREIRRSLSMGEYLRSHAGRLYAAAVMPETTAAANLLGKILAGKLVTSEGVVLDTFTARQVATKNWSGLGKTADVNKAAELLVDYDFLRVQTMESSAAGGRPSERYIINPEVLAEIRVA